MDEGTGKASASTDGDAPSAGGWSSFLKSIASFKGDLWTLTAPPFILSSTSLTEFSSYWCKHPALFTAAARDPDPQRRSLLVLRWFLSTLRQHYASRSEKYGSEKKPLNPFLGELFLGRWEKDEHSADLVSEQVSHHPPVTAYCVTNAPTGTRLQGYCSQKATFSTTIFVKQVGHALLTIPDPSDNSKTDTYLITLPSLHLDGLIYGTPYVELEGSSFITSSTGFTSRVDYSGKGWLSGKKNSLTAAMYRTGDEDVLFSVKGQWSGTIGFYEGPAKTQSKSTLIESLSTDELHATPLSVRPAEEQTPLESRRAWEKVAKAIAAGDMEKVGVEKSKIEKAQRAARASEKEEGRSWERQFFCAAEAADEAYVSLAKAAGLPAGGDVDKTGGFWRFDDGKAARTRARLAQPEALSSLGRDLLGQE